MKRSGSSIADPSKRDYVIKLLAGNNVVLVESKNYESEIFMPTIQEGRISFHNIIPNRRCCCHTFNTKPVNMDTSMMRTSIEQGLPIANSTPMLQKQMMMGCNKENIRFHGKQEDTNSQLSFQSYATPEPVRRAKRYSLQNITRMQSPTLKRSASKMSKIHAGMKVLRLFRKPTPGTPQKVGRLAAGQTPSKLMRSSMTIGDDLRANKSSFCLPCTPPRYMRSFNRPTLSSLQKQNVLHKDGSPKWRAKVLTPKRTYLRRPEAATALATALMQCLRSVKGNRRQLQSSTKCISPTHKVEVRNRHLIVDKKVNISPRSFKQQQTKSKEESRKNADNLKNALPRTRAHMDRFKSTAFDLLTNPNRARPMSHKLTHQFRSGCINKASSTYPKYRLLSTVPALEGDNDKKRPKPKPLRTIPPSAVIRKSGGMSPTSVVPLPPDLVSVAPSPVPAQSQTSATPAPSTKSVVRKSPNSNTNPNTTNSSLSTNRKALKSVKSK